MFHQESFFIKSNADYQIKNSTCNTNCIEGELNVCILE